MDADIFALVGKYGFRNLHTRLSEIMASEYEYLKTQFEVRIPEPVPLALTNTIEPAPVQKKVKKVRKQTVKADSDVVVSANPEVKDVIVVAASERQGYRDPKEIKLFQKTAEEAKYQENISAGIELYQVLTKDNLKQWIEVEGRTYAWVAREKAGCAETQVAATAQMMGIKSSISKKRGIIMSGK